jgi:hypothetical protein
MKIDETTMVDSAMRLLGEHNLITLNRGNSLKTAREISTHNNNEIELTYSQLNADTLTLIGIVDLVYLELKCKSVYIIKNMGITLTDEQSSIIATCDIDNYCKTLHELARLLSIRIEPTLISSNSTFTIGETKDIVNLFKELQ